VTGSTSDPSGFPGSRARLAVALVASALVVAALTALVFLMRAGGDPGDAATWPITWELRSSDNGTLFQFWLDVAAGRHLDWSFSPQVFVFPELVLSGAAFVVAGGNLYVYYVVVAVLNQVVFFLLLAALARVLWPEASPLAVVVRASAGILPLLLLPLVGTTWVFSFHLAPTYYVGMYLALLAGPLLFLVRTPAARIAVVLAVGLTIASNPLTVLFAAPGMAAVGVAALVRSGRRSLARPALLVVAVAVVAVVARLAFGRLQGTGLLTYVDVERFRSRVEGLWPYWSFQMIDPAARVLLPLGALLAVGCLVVAIIAWSRLAGHEAGAGTRTYAALYLGLVPLGGLAATVVALITHYYYFWPALILPFVLALFAVPSRWGEPVVVGGAVGALAIGVVTGGFTNLGSAGEYVGYRSAETRCLDDAVAGQVGFATFSDARRVGLPSATGIRLIPITADLAPNLWLTNRTYTQESGTFFYVNEWGDERALDGDALRARYGRPDRVVACSDGQRLWIYDEPLVIDSDEWATGSGSDVAVRRSSVRG
jgi:hypothetical protein